jgi:hypothetical protein
MSEEAVKKIFTKDGLHCHTCRRCGVVWQHPPPPSSVDCDAVHRCPKPGCSGTSYMKTPLEDVEHIDYPWTGVWPDGSHA